MNFKSYLHVCFKMWPLCAYGQTGSTIDRAQNGRKISSEETKTRLDEKSWHVWGTCCPFSLDAVFFSGADSMKTCKIFEEIDTLVNP